MMCGQCHGECWNRVALCLIQRMYEESDYAVLDKSGFRIDLVQELDVDQRDS